MTGTFAGRLVIPAFFALSLQCPSQSRLSAPQPAQAAPFQVVAGRVLSAADKRPLARATVSLTSQRNPQDTETERSDTEGRFRFPAKPAGRYLLRAEADGYLPSLYLEHDQFSSAIVLGANAASDRLDFELVAAASLHGRIVDEAGDSVRDAQIGLYRERDNVTSSLESRPSDTESKVQRAGSAQTDEDGRYDFTELRPGTYFVTVTATPWYAVHSPPADPNAQYAYRSGIDPALDVVYPEVFYPGVTNESEARPIVVKAGERVAANLSLTPQRSIELRFRLPSSDEGNKRGVRFPVLFRTVFGVELPVSGQSTGMNTDQSEVTISGVAPGSYHVRTSGPSGIEATERSLTATPGGTGGAIDLTDAGESASTVTMRVQATSGEALPADLSLQALLVPRRGFNVPLVGAKVVKGVANFPNMRPGSYQIAATGGGKAWTVVHIGVNGRNSPSRRLRIPVEAGTSVDLLLSQSAPTVEAVVVNAGRKPAVGAMAVLVPAGADAGEDLFRRDQSDLDGGVRFGNIAPGNYLLVAIADGWRLHWSDPATLAPYLAHATPVVVPDGGLPVLKIGEAVSAQPLR